MKRKFVTHEPSLIQKIMQMYWFNPKSWLLKSLTIDEDQIEIVTMNEKVFSNKFSQTKFKFQSDSYDRYEFYVSDINDKARKIHFKEIPFMLSDDEWEEIKTIFASSDNYKESLLGKVTRAASIATDVGKIIS